MHEDDEALRGMWENLTANPNPEMMAAFEEVLAKLTGDLHKKSAERADLESTLKVRISKTKFERWIFSLSMNELSREQTQTQLN